MNLSHASKSSVILEISIFWYFRFPVSTHNMRLALQKSTKIAGIMFFRYAMGKRKEKKVFFEELNSSTSKRKIFSLSWGIYHYFFLFLNMRNFSLQKFLLCPHLPSSHRRRNTASLLTQGGGFKINLFASEIRVEEFQPSLPSLFFLSCNPSPATHQK